MQIPGDLYSTVIITCLNYILFSWYYTDTRRFVQYCYYYMLILYIIQLVHADPRDLYSTVIMYICTCLCYVLFSWYCTDTRRLVQYCYFYMSIIIYYSVGTRIQRNYNVSSICIYYMMFMLYKIIREHFTVLYICTC